MATNASALTVVGRRKGPSVGRILAWAGLILAIVVVLVPFYWMIRAGWHSLAIGSVMAAVHALNLVLVASIASALLPRQLRYRFAWIVASVLVAAIGPVFAT